VQNNNDNSVENNDHHDVNDYDTNDSVSSDNQLDLFFDERLIEQGYSFTTLPNGFPLNIPYHLLLVEHNMNDEDATGFNGLFCYNLPFEPAGVANILESLNEGNFEHVDGDGDSLHTLHFSNDEDFMGANGTFTFINDEFDN